MPATGSDVGRPDISQRKADHLEVAASGRADFRRQTTLLEDVHLVHQAVPELADAEVDLSTALFGGPDQALGAPLVISGMTGGTSAARHINRDLARVAASLGIAFGVGSQRAMAVHPELEATFQVKDAAPDVFLIGNLGAVQVRELGLAKVRELVSRIGADALAVHLNPAQEMIQSHGDRDFRGQLAAIGDLCAALGVPVVVKETGCGLSREAATALFEVGVRVVDTGGAGGTSWVAVEAQRAAVGSQERALGEELWDWGVPTAVSVVACKRSGLEVIATGGMRSGLDVARALALGATAGGLAAPVLRAHNQGGEAGARGYLEGVIRSLRTVLLLCGCKRPSELVSAPRHLGGALSAWLDDLGLR